MLHVHGRARARGDRVVLATLVSRKGSTYRRAGARALVVGDDVTGLLSGGCLEADIAAHANDMLGANEKAKLVSYDLAANETADAGPFGLGHGCKGTLGIVLEELIADAEGPMEWLKAHVESDAPGAVAHLPLEGDHAGRVRRVWTVAGRTVVQGDVAEAERTRWARACEDVIRDQETREDGRAVIEYLAPALSLLLVGAGPDALPLVDLATALGWRVTAIDHRSSALAHPRLANAARVHVPIDALANAVKKARSRAVLVMTHNLRADREALRALTEDANVTGNAREYIGVLGPRARTESILKELGKDVAAIPSFHAPAGLDLGGDGADAVALSIASEIHATLHKKEGGPLSAKKGPIHDR
jgi:xanthine/CO dehydrogenase XdhC/CoxF family maturation factor